jgi:hypothetical protein
MAGGHDHGEKKDVDTGARPLWLCPMQLENNSKQIKNEF